MLKAETVQVAHCLTKLTIVMTSFSLTKGLTSLSPEQICQTATTSVLQKDEDRGKGRKITVTFLLIRCSLLLKVIMFVDEEIVHLQQMIVLHGLADVSVIGVVLLISAQKGDTWSVWEIKDLHSNGLTEEGASVETANTTRLDHLVAHCEARKGQSLLIIRTKGRWKLLIHHLLKKHFLINSLVSQMNETTLAFIQMKIVLFLL